MGGGSPPIEGGADSPPRPDLIHAVTLQTTLLRPVISRFSTYGVQQEGELRGCDDLEDSPTNTARLIAPPITLRGWGDIAEASLRLYRTKRERPFGKGVRRAAYKFLPVREEGPRFAAISLWCPKQRGGSDSAPVRYSPGRSLL